MNGHGIDSMAKIFLDFGYTQKDELSFPAKKLKAFWFSPPHASHSEGDGVEGPLPRIFISQLLVDQMSAEAQVCSECIHLLASVLHLLVFCSIATTAASSSRKSSISTPKCLAEDTSTRLLAVPLDPWHGIRPLIPSFNDSLSPVSLPNSLLLLLNYLCLVILLWFITRESEYTAWTLVNGYALNHATISVHRLDSHLNHINDLNQFVQDKGFRLNSEGGILKGCFFFRNVTTVANFL